MVHENEIEKSSAIFEKKVLYRNLISYSARSLGNPFLKHHPTSVAKDA
jgi:hypothetical protein